MFSKPVIFMLLIL